MEELVAKKMALAELSENHARLKRDLHRRAERDKVWPFAVPTISHASGSARMQLLSSQSTVQPC